MLHIPSGDDGTIGDMALAFDFVSQTVVEMVPESQHKLLNPLLKNCVLQKLFLYIHVSIRSSIHQR